MAGGLEVVCLDMPDRLASLRPAPSRLLDERGPGQAFAGKGSQETALDRREAPRDRSLRKLGGGGGAQPLRQFHRERAVKPRRQPRPLLEKLVDDRIRQREHGHVGRRDHVGARAHALNEGHLAKNVSGDEPRQNDSIPAPHFGGAGEEYEQGMRPVARLQEFRAARLLADGSERQAVHPLVVRQELEEALLHDVNRPSLARARPVHSQPGGQS